MFDHRRAEKFQSMLLLIVINVAHRVMFTLTVLMKPVIYYLFNVKIVQKRWKQHVHQNVKISFNCHTKNKKNYEKVAMLVIKYLKKDDQKSSCLKNRKCILP